MKESVSLIKQLITKLVALLFPDKVSILAKFQTFLMILLGAVILCPVVQQLPLLGWDWFFFFNENNPSYNISSPTSAYPPYTKFFISLLTWLPWRQSLAILNSLSLVTIAIGTWQNGGRYGSIGLALLTPPVWMLLWIGHPDGLALLGLITGIVPLALIKPHLTVWSMLSHKSLMAWTVIFLCFTFFLWPFWPVKLGAATLTHEAAFGWVVTGWPILALGLFLLLGAGNDPYRLMAAGFLVSPYLMPYNFAVLLPVIGKLRGYRKIIVWGSTWLLVFGVGLGGQFKYLNLVFPILAYCLTHSLKNYKANVRNLVGIFRYDLPRLLTR